VFAVVGEVVIRGEEFERAFQQAARQKFYHRKPPQGEFDALRREVGDSLIERVLLLAEARRPGLEPDPAQLDKALAEYDARYAHSAQWQQSRETLLPGLRRQLGEKDVLERLERSVRNGPAASDAQAKSYYDAHREQFTEPAKAKLSAILLKVDPSSPQAAWDRAREQAAQIVERLRAGADFAEMARLRSGDSSAANGGDLGYLHSGMLQESMQKVVDGLQPGATSAPVLVLEGVAIVRLERREPAKLRSFAEAKARAAALWERERAERRWATLVSRLRNSATIRVDASRYPARDARRGGSGEKGA
jgi:parvulin-like peptidyl-prolyl isomerase